MENASKALIIAGAILISILLISVGIMIFKGSSGIFSSATTQMSEQEKTMFNTRFTMYEGKISGSQVKALLNEVILNNNNDDNPDITVNNTAPTSSTVIPGGINFNSAKTYRVTIDAATGYKEGLVSNITIEIL